MQGLRAADTLPATKCNLSLSRAQTHGCRGREERNFQSPEHPAAAGGAPAAGAVVGQNRNGGCRGVSLSQCKIFPTRLAPSANACSAAQRDVLTAPSEPYGTRPPSRGGDSNKPPWRAGVLRPRCVLARSLRPCEASHPSRARAACPRRHRDEVDAVFPGVGYEGLLVIPTCQHSRVDLVAVGAAVEEEKDALLRSFTRFAVAVCDRLAARGHWADYIDPCSGLPMVHRGGAGVYGEVDALVTLLRYTTSNAGCCKVALHPRWGSSVYPASIFTKAPAEEATEALAAVAAELCAFCAAA